MRVLKLNKSFKKGHQPAIYSKENQNNGWFNIWHRRKNTFPPDLSRSYHTKYLTFSYALFRYVIYFYYNRPLSRRPGRRDRMIQNESGDSNGGNVYYVTMQISFLTLKFRNVKQNLHCDLVHITTKWVFCLTLDCNGVFAIKAYYSCFKWFHSSARLNLCCCLCSWYLIFLRWHSCDVHF